MIESDLNYLRKCVQKCTPMQFYVFANSLPEKKHMYFFELQASICSGVSFHHTKLLIFCLVWLGPNILNNCSKSYRKMSVFLKSVMEGKTFSIHQYSCSKVYLSWSVEPIVLWYQCCQIKQGKLGVHGHICNSLRHLNGSWGLYTLY